MSVSPELERRADALVDAQRRASLALQAHQQALQYYRTGDFKRDGIAADLFGPLLDALTTQHMSARDRAEALQRDFTTLLEHQVHDRATRENLKTYLLANARARQAPAPPNAFQEWLETEVLSTDEPEPAKSRRR